MFSIDLDTVSSRVYLSRHKTDLAAVCDSWCPQVHQGSSLMRDIICSVGEPRAAELADPADLDTFLHPLWYLL